MAFAKELIIFKANEDMKHTLPIVFFNTICLIATCLITTGYDYYQKDRLATFVVKAQRNNLIIRDISAVSGELSALIGIFNEVKIQELQSIIPIYKTDGSIQFLPWKITKSIFTNTTMKNRLVDVIFYYDLLNPLMMSFFIWLALSAFLSPAFVLYRINNYKKIALDNKNLLDLKFTELARQVAHDIRSPLTALGIITKKLQPINSEEILLVQEVFNRINEIAENLLQSTKNIPSHTKNLEEKFVPSKVIIDIINEKKLLTGKDITVSFDSDTKSDGILCSGIKAEFARILSNLIQNSFEAKLAGKPLSINIFLRNQEKFLNISILDDGCGISEELLPKLAIKGNSFNKKSNTSGHGLGLYHAKQCIKNWGGDFQIFSRKDQGTQVTLALAKFH
ncbi:MAG: HAMP domain-containing sensor histidine kinase [Bdellovibrionota bacterium]